MSATCSFFPHACTHLLRSINLIESIDRSTDERTIKVKPSDLQPPNPMAKAMGADQYTSDAAELMAVPDYDKKVLQQKVRPNCMLLPALTVLSVVSTLSSATATIRLTCTCACSTLVCAASLSVNAAVFDLCGV